MSKIHEDLEIAEEALTRAVGKLLHHPGGRMPNGFVWVGQMEEVRKGMSLLLKLQSLRKKVASYETKKEK